MGWLVLIVTAWAACGTSSGGFLLVWGGVWLGGLGPGGLVLEGVVLSEGVSGVGALSLGGQRYYAQRLVPVDRPGTRLQHIANVFCSHTYYPIDSTYR